VKDFRCPACGFRVFNRRCPLCEGCGGELPTELLFSAEEIDRRDREHAKEGGRFVPDMMELARPPRRSGWRGVLDDLLAPWISNKRRWWWLN
jgi:hypothetical protein